MNSAGVQNMMQSAVALAAKDQVTKQLGAAGEKVEDDDGAEARTRLGVRRP